MWRILVVFLFVLLKGGGSDKVLISADKTVWMADTDRREVTLVMNSTNQVYNLDYHFTRGYLYYTNAGSIMRRMFYLDTVDENPVTVVKHQQYGYINSIAVDWVHNTLYWTTWETAVFMADLDGYKSSAILNFTSSNERTLDHILVDPFEKVLFMIYENDATGNLESVFIRTDIYGKDLTRILSLKAAGVYSTSIDVHKKKLYAAGTLTSQNKGILYVIEYDGTYQQFLGGTTERIYEIQVFLKSMYMMVHSIGNTSKPLFCKVDVESTPTVTSCKSQQLLDDSDIPDFITGLRVYDKNAQMSPKRAGVHQCEQKGCSYACMVVPTGGPTCVCSTGMQIDADGKTCREDEGVQLLVSGSGRIAKISVSTNSSSVVMEDKNKLFVDFSYFNKSLFVVISKNDKHLLQLCSYDLQPQQIICEDTRRNFSGEVSALGIDWSHDSVYIFSTRTTNEAISRIWLVKLIHNRWAQGHTSTSLLLNSNEYNVNNVKVLLVDPFEKLIFMMMVNSAGFGVILKSDLQGEGLVKLQRPDDNIIAMDIDIRQKRVYILRKTSDITYIGSFTYEFTDEITFTSKEKLPTVIRMSVYNGSIFLATKSPKDNTSTTFYHATIDRTDKLTLEQMMTERIDLTAMRVYLPQTQLSSEDQTCLEMGCSHVCEVVSPSPLTNYQSLACACPENMRLDKKGTSCTEMFKPDKESSSSSTNYIKRLLLLVGVVPLAIVFCLCCLFKRYGLTIGRDRWEYRSNWWRRETDQGEMTLQMDQK